MRQRKERNEFRLSSAMPKIHSTAPSASKRSESDAIRNAYCSTKRESYVTAKEGSRL